MRLSQLFFTLSPVFIFCFPSFASVARELPSHPKTKLMRGKWQVLGAGACLYTSEKAGKDDVEWCATAGIGPFKIKLVLWGDFSVMLRHPKKHEDDRSPVVCRYVNCTGFLPLGTLDLERAELDTPPESDVGPDLGLVLSLRGCDDGGGTGGA
ncbi:unnamed protein product, partial [Phaeothamnion confervicola]